MTKDYEEYKVQQDKHSIFRIILKVVEILLVIGCVLAGLMFILMLAFPKNGWVELFK